MGAGGKLRRHYRILRHGRNPRPIPLFNYGDTYDRETIDRPIEDLLRGQVCAVEIGYEAYNSIKKGALKSLAALDLSKLANMASLLGELDAFRYDWVPELDVADRDPALAEERGKLANLAGPSMAVARFLLGGFVFSGFAQASDTTHYIQPKRSRYLLGLTAVPDKINTLSGAEEGYILGNTV